MILYYYPNRNLLAMWYYKMVKGEKEMWTWVLHLGNNRSTLHYKAPNPSLNEIRLVGKYLEDTGWCELLEDTGDA